jgi:acyl-lipid omega-6 desaturase (Delta-12 desaturase)
VLLWGRGQTESLTVASVVRFILMMKNTVPAIAAGTHDCPRRPNTARSILQVSVDFVYFGVLIWGVIDLPLIGKLMLAVPLQLAFARLFILGHDACHGSLFASPLANQIVGRLVFLPTLTTFSLWHVGHNLAHHGFANLKGRDQVWAPLSPQEYSELPRTRQALERLYRSVWGLGLYYGIELWWKRLFFPSKQHTGARRYVLWLDACFTALCGAAYVAFLIWRAEATGQHWWLIVLLGAVVPFMLWNYLMGFVTFVHHTSPDVRWFDNRSRWARMGRNGEEFTRDIHLPLWTHNLLHGIMQHRAHHFDPRIPNYHLDEATRKLFGSETQRAKTHWIGWSELRRITKRCALYDYGDARWLRFSAACAPETSSRRLAPR